VREALLEGSGLERTYWLGATPVQALGGVDVTIRRGEFVVLQGPSGSGKTTLINLLGLLDRPDAGRLTLDGVSVAALDENARADLRRDRFGFVFQSFNLVAVLTAAENIEYPMMLKGVPRETRRRHATELLSRVGLAEKASVRPDLLSGGQRQRVAIARALANEPEVILADEPTANLDTKTADEVLDLMARINEERQVAFVLSSHDPRVVARAQRVLTLRDGRLAGSSAPP
jgi:putative ABC transport system ATP-binding protein